MEYPKKISVILFVLTSLLYPRLNNAQVVTNWNWVKNTASWPLSPNILNNQFSFQTGNWPFVLDEQGNTYIIGTFSDSIRFENKGKNVVLYSHVTKVYIEKISQAGNFVWAKSGFDSSVSPSAATISKTGKIYINGAFGNNVPLENGAQIMCYDTSANHIWTDIIYGDYATYPLKIQSDSAGNIAAVENIWHKYWDTTLNSYTGIPSSSGYFLHIDSTGKILSNNIIYTRDAWDDDLSNMALDQYGNTYVECTTLDAGGDTIEAYYLLKFNNNGRLAWKKSIDLSCIPYNSGAIYGNYFGGIQIDKYSNLYFSGLTYQYHKLYLVTLFLLMKAS